MGNYISLPKPLTAYIKASQILPYTAIESPYIPCQLIGLCLYEGEAITFMIRLEEGVIFSYIPSTALSLSPVKNTTEPYTLENLVYLNCPSIVGSVSTIDALGETTVSCYIKGKDTWLEGEYVCTLDFHLDNELVNLVKLKDVGYAFLPFHKIKFSPLNTITPDFKPYIKQRDTYIV